MYAVKTKKRYEDLFKIALQKVAAFYSPSLSKQLEAKFREKTNETTSKR